MRSLRFRPLLLGLALLLSACLGVDPEPVREGTIRFVDIEGGCWVLEAPPESYRPLNLGEEFRVDGLRVEFAGEVVTNVAGFCPGTPFQLSLIARAN